MYLVYAVLLLYYLIYGYVIYEIIVIDLYLLMNNMVIILVHAHILMHYHILTHFIHKITNFTIFEYQLSSFY